MSGTGTPTLFNDRRIRTSLLAILADALLVVIKMATAWATGSAALLADAYHSITDFAVSTILLVGLVTRHRQERTGNPAAIARAYRFEAILAILVALLILYVPVEIVREVQGRSPEELKNLWVGIAGVLLSIAIAWFMARLKTWVGRDTDSPALEADGYHSQMDVFSSIAVLVSLVGMMIGIYLDEIVAVIIAVMVGVAGVELLVAGFRSLLRGGELQQLSLLETATRSLAANRVYRWLQAPFIGLWQTYQRTSKVLLLVLALCLYATSGLSIVPHGQVGIKQVLNRSQGAELPPGLYYALPWPFGDMQLLTAGYVNTLTLGRVETPAAATPPAPQLLWQQAFLSDPEDRYDALLMTTSDENLVNIQLSLHYQTQPTLPLQVNSADTDRLIAHVAESALWQQVSRLSFRQLLDTPRDAFAASIASQIKADMQALGLPLVSVNAQIQSLQPPPRVVQVYRDAFDARQEQQRLELEASGERAAELSKANAAKLQRLTTADSNRSEQQQRALGDAQRFREISSVFRQYPEVIRFNQYLDTVTDKLAGKPLTITDPAIHSNDLRVWKGATPPEKAAASNQRKIQP
ncbi:protease modulator HflK family protein [Thiothrix nivea]|uniref:Cation diffusion facilitator family transporter n=1 Tax=Thiothrix nivea (strain ATCC 35100 / DSM 5205 / JP2) TaxID=870187 RepID=A0A656HB55_THINJ|nr:protease modulator HflK family protein [Thiothrix nivea]EIJ33587.1 cation diffusion facilitator family transporter [Thiothrix nivea DSM 5205]